jgi:drug/metabolite transporter (DMT)-like permease
MLMSFGQILFKSAAQSLQAPLGFDLPSIWRILGNPQLLAGIGLYGFTTVLWVLILRGTELSRAYPFVALSMVFVPAAGIILFGERFSMSLLVGGSLILCGLWFIARSA